MIKTEKELHEKAKEAISDIRDVTDGRINDPTISIDTVMTICDHYVKEINKGE